MTDKKSLSERDICFKYITPAITEAGWDLYTQIREEVSFTKGRIIVRGKLHTCGELILSRFCGVSVKLGQDQFRSKEVHEI